MATTQAAILVTSMLITLSVGHPLPRMVLNGGPLLMLRLDQSFLEVRGRGSGARRLRDRLCTDN